MLSDLLVASRPSGHDNLHMLPIRQTRRPVMAPIAESYVIFPREEGWFLSTPSGDIGPFKSAEYAIGKAKKYVSHLTKSGRKRGYSVRVLVRTNDGQDRLALSAFSS